VIAAALAATFAVGFAAPNAIPQGDAAALGATVNRETLTWHGETTYSGRLSFTNGARTFVLVFGPPDAQPATLEAYCSFLGSLLDRYPQVFAINIGGEPLAWSALDATIAAMRACGPVVRAHGALVGGPAFHPYQVQHSAPWLARIGVLGRALDFVSIDPYWAYGHDAEFVANARAAFGWRIPVWIAEDGIDTTPEPPFDALYSGATPASWTYHVSEDRQGVYVRAHMIEAYCAGVALWDNFLLEDDPRLAYWNSGLRHPDGSPKPAYAAFAETSAELRSGRFDCPSRPAPPPSPRPHPRQHPNDPNFRGWA